MSARDVTGDSHAGSPCRLTNTEKLGGFLKKVFGS